MTCHSSLVARSLMVSFCFLMAGPTIAAAEVRCPQRNSGGTPIVYNNHIFCGDVKDGVAGGFHSRPHEENPKTITNTDNKTIPRNAPAGIYDLNKFTITDSRGDTAEKPKSTMFPDDCEMPDVVAAIQNAASGGRPGSVFTGSSGRFCQAGDPKAPFEILVTLGDDGQVVSAYPNYH